MTREENLALIRRTFAAAARNDLDAVMESWAEDGVLCDWTLDRIVRGHDELRPYLEEYFAAWPDLTFSPTNIIVDGDTVVVEWAATATHTGPFFGAPPTGRTYDLRGVDIFELRGGKIAEERSFYGNGTLVTDLRR
jgi:steroid delta-isomerase-like uncharacterized protein